MHLSEIGVNISCNIVAALLSLFIVFYLLKPKITITTSIYQNDGYQIEITNKSFFKLYDINAQLWICTQIHIEGEDEPENNYKPLNLVAYNVIQIPFRPSWLRRHSLSNKARFRTRENLSSFLVEPNNSIVFLVTAKHEMSGLTGVFREDFNLAQIRQGFFP